MVATRRQSLFWKEDTNLRRMKLLSLLVSLVFIISVLASCGKPTGTENKTSESTTATTEKKAEETTGKDSEPTSAKPVKITISKRRLST